MRPHLYIKCGNEYGNVTEISAVWEALQMCGVGYRLYQLRYTTQLYYDCVG